MNVLYLGYFCNENLFNELVEAGSKSSHARQQFETNLLEGLIQGMMNDKLEIISYLPEIDTVKNNAGVGEEYKGIHIKYLWCNKKNLSSIIKAVYKNKCVVKQWIKQTRGEKQIILTYSVNPLLVIPAFWLRIWYQVPIVTICSEISTFRRKGNLGFINSISRKIASLLDNGFDGYILLTEAMNEIVNKAKRPNIVVEGIATRAFENEKNVQKKRAILYAGGLTQDNGIEILLDGFIKLGQPETELWIYGEGPLENLVKMYANKYSNIHFHGIRPHKEILEKEKEAMLLISPRLSNNEFTKYSFPSKIIEYMSSGTPVILTKLPGIPKEYFEYVYILENESANGIQKMLEKLLMMNQEELEHKGAMMRNFILTNKDSQKQGKRIVDFLVKVIR